MTQLDSQNEPAQQINGHMTAAVLYGSENLKIEKVDIPAPGAGRSAGARQGGA